MHKNTNLVFISDNDNFITRLFDDLVRELSTAAANGNDILYADIVYKIPICKELPDILARWSSREYLLSGETGNLPPYLADDEDPDSNIISYIDRAILINYGREKISYLHVKPLLVLDLSPCINGIAAVYTDLCTRYATLKLKTPKEASFCPLLFVSSPVDSLSCEDWLNLFRNYLFITARVSDQNAPYGLNCIPCPESDERSDTDILADMITTQKSSISLPGIITQLTLHIKDHPKMD